MDKSSPLYKKIKKKADKIVQDALENIREEVATQIEMHFELYIDEFYAHYPEDELVWYDRTSSTYLASDSYKDLSVALSRGSNRVGILVSSDNIPGNPYYVPNRFGKRKDGSPVDKDWVFENTFEGGLHGYQKPYIGHYPMDKPPYTSMEKWFNELKKNKGKVQDKIKEEALADAIKRNLK